MLDVLVEAIIELFTVKQPNSQQQTRRPRQPAPQGDDGWPEPSADDPFRKDHEGDIAPGQRVTLEDLVRKIAGLEPDDATRMPPVVAQPVARPPQRPTSPRRAEAGGRVRRPQAGGKRNAASAPNSEAAVESVRQAGMVRQAKAAANPAPTPAFGSTLGAASGDGNGALDFVAKLRDNPDAAREAFVFSEIFGRPLGER